MKKLFIFLHFISLLLRIPSRISPSSNPIVTHQQCIYTFPFDHSSFASCSSQHNIELAENFFPSQWADGSSPKIFSFDLQISVVDDCAQVYPASLFTIQLNNGGPQAFSLLDFFYTDAPFYNVYLHDKDGPVMEFSLLGQNDIGTYEDFELAATIDLSVGTIKIYFAFQETTYYDEATLAMVDSWQFDSNTRMEICADINGNPNFYCRVNSFNYWHTTPLDLRSFIGSLTPLLQASYRFTEGTGNIIGDSSANLGNAYFGESGPSTSDPTYSPYWLSTEAGIQFNSTAQYITIKPFYIPQNYQYDRGSFTITFWFKRAANGGGYIFRYSNSDLSYDYFALRISDTGNIRGAIYGQTTTATTSVSIKLWTLITATFALHATDTGNYVIINVGDSYVLSQKVTDATPVYSYSTSNKVRIGGPSSFKGSLFDFRIYAPGSSAIIDATSCTDPTQSTTCSKSFGKVNNNECVTKSDVTCDSTCKKCYDSTATSCRSCYDGFHISYSKCVPDTTPTMPTTPTTPTTTTPVLSPTTTDTIEGSQKSAQVATQVVNALTAGSPSGVSAAIGGKIFFNIKFINISYAKNLEEALTSWNSNFISLGLTPDLPSSIKDQIPNEDVPYVFDKREVPSSFLENFWESLGMLIFVAVIFLGVFIFEWIVTKIPCKYLPRNLLFAVRAIVQNFLLAQLYSVFGDVVFFASLEYHAPNTHEKWSRLSLASGIALLVLMLVILGFHLQLLRKYQKIRKTNAADLAKFENDNKGSNVLFNDFKDISIARQSFLLFLTGRDLLFSLLLTTMFEHPLIECIFILVLNLAMVAYLLLLPPFKSNFDAAQQLFYEVVTLAVNVSVLILAIMDQIDSPDNPGFRSQIGRFIIIINMVFNFGSLAFMLVKAFQTLYEIYQAYKERKSKHKVDLKIQTPDRLVKTSGISSQKKTPFEKSKVDILELDQSTLKPLDLTEEDFITNKGLLIAENTPQLETISHGQDTPQTEDDDEKVKALKDILEKNERAKKKFELSAKSNAAAHRIRNVKQISQNNVVSSFREMRKNHK